MIQNIINISANLGSSVASKIGKNVCMDPDAVIFGEITTADKVLF